MPSRRDLLRAGGLALAAGLAGCYTGAFPWSTIGVDIREPFATEGPVEVPVGVSIDLQNVDDERVAMNDVAVVLFTASKKRIGIERLGDFSWRSATEAQRSTETVDVTFGEQTVYRAGFDIDTTVSTGRVPAWVTVRIGSLQFGDETYLSAARNTQPPPKLRAFVRRYDGERPPPPTVTPDDYRSASTKSYVEGVDESGVVFPERVETDRGTGDGTRTTRDRTGTAPGNESG